LLQKSRTFLLQIYFSINFYLILTRSETVNIILFYYYLMFVTKYLKLIVFVYQIIMNIDKIQNKYKYLIIDTQKDVIHVLKSDRQVSELLVSIYDIKLSHMYIKRNLNNKDYILIDDILIKNIWA
jgi:hypothetical protein